MGSFLLNGLVLTLGLEEGSEEERRKDEERGGEDAGMRGEKEGRDGEEDEGREGERTVNGRWCRLNLTHSNCWSLSVGQLVSLVSLPCSLNESNAKRK